VSDPLSATELAVINYGPGAFAEERRAAFPQEGREGLSGMRARADFISSELKGVPALAGRAAPGASYGVLASRGFRVYGLENAAGSASGAVLENLAETVFRLERQALEAGLEQEAPSEAATPGEISPGCYFLDVEGEKLLDPFFSSRKSVLAFFESTAFERLELKCSHTPPGLKTFCLGGVSRLNLSSRTLEDGAVSVEVTHYPGASHSELVGVKWRSDGGCGCGA
jgi:hypothetical protein